MFATNFNKIILKLGAYQNWIYLCTDWAVTEIEKKCRNYDFLVYLKNY